MRSLPSPSSWPVRAGCCPRAPAARVGRIPCTTRLFRTSGKGNSPRPILGPGTTPHAPRYGTFPERHPRKYGPRRAIAHSEDAIRKFCSRLPRSACAGTNRGVLVKDGLSPYSRHCHRKNSRDVPLVTNPTTIVFYRVGSSWARTRALTGHRPCENTHLPGKVLRGPRLQFPDFSCPRHMP